MAEEKIILVIYDSRSIRETLAVVAGEPGCRLVELDDHESLSKRLRELQPAMVVICAMTRNTTAYETCRRVKKASRDRFLPVLVYMLKISARERKRARDAGADDLVAVGRDPEELWWRIHSWLRICDFVRESQQRTHSIARASAEAADMMLQLEEADRRIREQNEELEKMLRELEERDVRIRAQQAQIQRHLDTLRREMELASNLQVNLLPRTPPRIEGVSLYDRYVPAAELCGDYYDYAHLAGGAFHISIADVTGHGVAPALVSVQVRTLARAAVGERLTPSRILARLNEFMVETFHQDYLMTMVCMHYDPAVSTLTYAGAGHCPLLWYSTHARGIVELYSQGMPLGVSKSANFVDETVRLVTGDRVLLYTDGITETPGDTPGETFGVRRLREVFEAGMEFDGDDALGMVFQAARSYSARDAFEDDVTLVLLDRHARAAAGAGAVEPPAQRPKR